MISAPWWVTLTLIGMTIAFAIVTAGVLRRSRGPRVLLRRVTVRWLSLHTLLQLTGAGTALLFVLAQYSRWQQLAFAFVLLNALNLCCAAIALARAGLASRNSVASLSAHNGMLLFMVTVPNLPRPTWFGWPWPFTIVATSLIAVYLILSKSGGFAPTSGRLHKYPTVSSRGVVILLAGSLGYLTTDALLKTQFGDSTARRFVEKFEPTPPSSSLDWEEWERCTRTLQALEVELDLAGPRAFMLEQLQHEGKGPILGVGLRTGIIDAKAVLNLVTVEELRAETRSALRDDQNLTIRNPRQLDWSLRTLHQLDLLTTEDRRVLRKKLDTTIEKQEPMERLTGATELWTALGLGTNENHRTSVHAMLKSLWVSEPGLVMSSGGFSSYPTSDYCRIEATYDAILLMQEFGPPEGLDTRRLWGYALGERGSLHRLNLTAIDGRRAMAICLVKELGRTNGIEIPPVLARLEADPTPVAFALLVLIGLFLSFCRPSPHRPSPAALTIPEE